MTINTESLLTLSQWLSPAYPVGSFVFSHGLEQAIVSGTVTDKDSLIAWLAAVLAHGAGRNDCILIGAAWRGGDLPHTIACGEALQPSRERLLEARTQGLAFAKITRDVRGYDLPDTVFPVVFGRAAALAGAPLVPAAQMYLLAFVTNLVQAAQRLMPLGQTRAQQAIEALSPLCAQTALEKTALTLDDLGGFALSADIAAMRHETLQPRLFRS
ncbi:Urease accessory protein UreF [Ketogulonicigenium robustum]|uniref:Urease accessory protein UreF n=1 Tax=Ketogulonicigenium robustum TaxID=92947 RepID=A0A1W6NXY5_9RHOB|nr:urease accessory protein UreF [Ketogulonicigenium robustum]ARO14023.1 Urease accessory protein UreF [Ketogulonicigenium robustum]